MKRNDRGQSMVEFGLLIAFLLAIVLGGVDIGLAVHNMLVMQDAVGRGAQVAAIGGSDEEIQDEIYNYLMDTYYENILVKGTFGDSGVVITPPDGQRGLDSSVTVAIDYRLGFGLGYLFEDVYLWRWPITHTTTVELAPPTASSLPFTNGFEDGLTQWTVGGGGASGLSSNSPHGGTKELYFNGNSKNNNNTAQILVAKGAVTAVTVKWWRRSDGTVDVGGGGGDVFYMEYSTDGGTSWTTAFIQNGGPGGSGGAVGYTQESCSISGLPAGDFSLRFRGHLTGNDEFFYIDDISVEE